MGFWAPSLLRPLPESARKERCCLHLPGTLPGPRATPSGACSCLQCSSAIPRSLRKKGKAGKAPTSRKTKARSEQETAQGRTPIRGWSWTPGLLGCHPCPFHQLHLNSLLRTRGKERPDEVSWFPFLLEADFQAGPWLLMIQEGIDCASVHVLAHTQVSDCKELRFTHKFLGKLGVWRTSQKHTSTVT